MPTATRLGATASVAGCLAAALLTGAAAARTPVCSGAQLTPVYVDSTAGAGSVDGEYAFRNRGPHSCVLSGYPSVRLRTRSGAPLPTSEQHAVGAYGITVRQLSLAAGARAYFGVHYASQTGYDNRRCPTSGALELTAPGTSAALLLRGVGGQIQPYGGTIEHLRCGTLEVSALSAKRFQ